MTTTPPGSAHDRARGFSRRAFFGGAAGGAALGALGGVGGTLAAGALAAEEPESAELSYPFYGTGHQAGIRTPPQRYSVFMSLDMTSDAVRDLQVLLARWSAGIAELMKGSAIGQVQPPRPDAVAADTGEALGLGPNGLTVTVGLGPGIFDDRFGLQRHRPALLRPLPTLPSDQLDPSFTGGDLSLQACANDPQVAYHAVRDLARMVRETAATRWAVMGFGRASAGANQSTPRNLMGFKDGTRNVSTDREYSEHVWLGDEHGWMAQGTYQVVRKIRMDIETWDADVISDQQAVFGRTKESGAPLTGQREHDAPDFSAEDGHGRPVIPNTAHIALAAHENNGGIKILRRSYNYTDGINGFGQLDAGLLFIAYVNDPGHFVTLQSKLGAVDRLNEYISHIGSGLFAVPPAPKRGHYIAQALF